MATLTEHGERLARIEGAYEHLATKADIEALRGELKAYRWQVSLGVPLITVVVSQMLERLL